MISSSLYFVQGRYLKDTAMNKTAVAAKNFCYYLNHQCQKLNDIKVTLAYDSPE